MKHPLDDDRLKEVIYIVKLFVMHVYNKCINNAFILNIYQPSSTIKSYINSKLLINHLQCGYSKLFAMHFIVKLLAMHFVLHISFSNAYINS